MASTSPRLAGESSTGAATFSYAQAAKGRVASATVSTLQSSQATSGANTPPKELNSLTDTSAEFVNGTLASELDRKPKTNGDHTMAVVSTGPEIDYKATSHAIYGPSSPSFGTASTATLPKEDMSSSTPNLATDSPWERPHMNETSNEKVSEGSDRKKGKKGKKDKTADRETEFDREEVKPAILVAARPPAINIWQQRKEAQAAIAKVSPQTAETPQFPEANANGLSVNAAAKSNEGKKKSKFASEEQDKASNAGQHIGGKDSQASKGQKKGDGNNRSKEDSNGKRAPRGGRLSEKEEKSVATQLPPPVEDAISWPTPEIALEEKRKTQEKVEKEDKEESVSNKPRPKEKWVTVPYVPSVAFSTPLPVRGGRGGRGNGRGGRDGNTRSGHASNGSVSGDKALPSTTGSNNNETRERGRDNSNNNNRAASLPPNSSKRPSGEEQRKASASTFDKSKQELSSTAAKGEYNHRENRRASIAPQSDSMSGYQTPNQQGTGFGRIDATNGITTDSQTQQKAGGPDRKVDPNPRNDYPKDANGQGSSRERGEGRSERGGRGGGFRGRGGHNNFPSGQTHPQNIFTSGQVTQVPNGYSMRQNSGPYSPPIQQQQFGGPFTPNAPVRGNRNSLPPPRSHSIPNHGNLFTRYPSNMGPGSQQMPPLQTGGPMFDYTTSGSMSAVPYNPYVEQWSILSMVTMQLEYYFSIDNLCKDVFLRKHMDSQGFVILSFIANFKRIQTLTTDYYLVRFACQESDSIDIIQGEDGIERVRRRDGWDKWILGIEERDPVAQYDGPSQIFSLPPSNRGPQTMMPGMIPPPQAPISAPAFTPNGNEPGFQPFPTSSMNPVSVENTTFQPPDQTMSAAVPDFAPRLQSNGAENNDFDSLKAETTFTDEQIDNLQLVWKFESDIEDTKPAVPFQGTSSRTFSNGSIDVRSIAEELSGGGDKRQGRTLANGTNPGVEMSPDGLRRSKSPHGPLSPTKPTFGNAPPVMWAKDQNQQVPISETNTRLPYGVIRNRALRQRELSFPGVTHSDMKILYDFWSHFLIRNFNPRMYLEFRDLAFDDSRNRKDATGMKKLVQFYDEILNSKKKTIPEVFANHYIDLVRSEDPTSERPGFTKLRATWRNGALDMKSRKKIDNVVDPKLREELER